MTASSTISSANGMSCTHRASAVARAMQQVDVGTNMQVGPDKQTVAVASGVSTNIVKATIEQAGYPVKSSG